MRDQTQSTTCRWHGDVMRRAGTRTYPRQEGKGQDRSCSSVRFVFLVSGHCSPCFCSMSRLTHNSRKPGTKNTVASTATTQTQRGGPGWFLDAPFYFSLTPGLFSSSSSTITLRLYLHSYSAYSPPPPKPPPTPALSPYTFTCTKRALLPLACACRLTHTHLNVPSASISASFISIVWSTRVRVAMLSDPSCGLARRGRGAQEPQGGRKSARGMWYCTHDKLIRSFPRSVGNIVTTDLGTSTYIPLLNGATINTIASPEVAAVPTAVTLLPADAFGMIVISTSALLAGSVPLGMILGQIFAQSILTPHLSHI